MTMNEKIRVHAQIEAENRDNLKRWKAKEIYRDFVRGGQYYEGRLILRMLRHGRVVLGLGDAAWNVQTVLEDAGFRIWFSRNGYQAIAYI